jgi:hypothetical protein
LLKRRGHAAGIILKERSERKKNARRSTISASREWNVNTGFQPIFSCFPALMIRLVSSRAEEDEGGGEEQGRARALA